MSKEEEMTNEKLAHELEHVFCRDGQGRLLNEAARRLRTLESALVAERGRVEKKKNRVAGLEGAMMSARPPCIDGFMCRSVPMGFLAIGVPTYCMRYDKQLRHRTELDVASGEIVWPHIRCADCRAAWKDEVPR